MFVCSGMRLTSLDLGLEVSIRLYLREAETFVQSLSLMAFILQAKGKYILSVLLMCICFVIIDYVFLFTFFHPLSISFCLSLYLSLAFSLSLSLSLSISIFVSFCISFSIFLLSLFLIRCFLFRLNSVNPGRRDIEATITRPPGTDLSTRLTRPSATVTSTTSYRSLSQPSFIDSGNFEF